MLLVAVIGCNDRAHYFESQLKTWVPSLHCPCYFFVGNSGDEKLPRESRFKTEIQLDVADDYFSVPDKTQLAVQWALDHGYTEIIKCDDDAYIHGLNLWKYLAELAKNEYVGRQRPGFNFLSGGAYFLNQSGMGILAYARKPSTIVSAAGIPQQPYEDSWVGTVMMSAGINCVHDSRFLFSKVPDGKRVYPDESRDDCIAEFEFPGLDMYDRHWKVTRDVIRPSLEWRVRNMEFVRQHLEDKKFF